MKTMNSELVNADYPDGIESLVDEIITEAKSLSTISTSNSPQTSSTANTLQMEHNQLKLNLK